jgi:hypothetical protein
MADPTRVDRMAVVAGIDALRAELSRLFIVVGVFDGLHLGHLYLLGFVREEAARRNASPTSSPSTTIPTRSTAALPPCDADERLTPAAAGAEVTVVHFDVASDDRVRRLSGGSLRGAARRSPDPRSGLRHERRGTRRGRSGPVGYDVEVILAELAAGRSGVARSTGHVAGDSGAARLPRLYAVGEEAGRQSHSLRF